MIVKLGDISGYVRPPNITGAHDGIESYYTRISVAFYFITPDGVGSGDSDNDNAGIGFSASRSNSIYGSSTTVQVPSVLSLPVIKF